MELCEACGTENRDKAKFCRGCARALVPVAAGADLADKASNRALRCGVCQAIYSRGETTCQACGLPLNNPVQDASPEEEPTRSKARRWPLFGALALVGVALVMWGMNPSKPMEAGPGATTAPSEASPVVQPALEKPVLPAPPASPPSIEAGMSAEEKAHFEELVTREAERAEKSRKSIARLAAQEKAAKEAKEARAARAEAERLRTETARQAVAQPAAAAPVDSKPATALQAPPPPAANVSVEQACAKTTNFLSRDLCRVAACEDAGNARDPICVWFRKIESDRAKRLQGN